MLRSVARIDKGHFYSLKVLQGQPIGLARTWFAPEVGSVIHKAGRIVAKGQSVDIWSGDSALQPGDWWIWSVSPNGKACASRVEVVL